MSSGYLTALRMTPIPVLREIVGSDPHGRSSSMGSKVASIRLRYTLRFLWSHICRTF